MKKHWLWAAYGVGFVVMLAGCHSIPISDEQIETIVTAVNGTIEAAVPIVASVASGGSIPVGATAGLATLLALGVGYGTRALLRALQKKPTA